MYTTKNNSILLDFDEDGLLRNPEQWNESVAETIAEQLGIGELKDAHWNIIHALRRHYAVFGVPPAMHNLCRNFGMETECINELFHNCLEAWIVAGLPNPGEEAKTYMNVA